VFHAARRVPAPVLAAALFVLGLSAYANAALLVGPELQRWFPPFAAGVRTNFNSHLGAEYFYIALALAKGDGFANPFGVPTGPTAWMPPVYPALLAVLLWLTGGSHAGVATAVVLLQNATWIATAALVFAIARETRRRLAPAAALAFLGLWSLAHFYWFFQLTHDVWIAMAAIDALVWQGWRLLRRSESVATLPARAGASLGLAGGLALLTQPIAGFAFGIAALWLGAQKPALRRAAALALALTAALGGLWTARNFATFGELVLVKSNLAFDAYQANVLSESGIYDEVFFREHPVWTSTRDPNSLIRREGERAFAAHYRAELARALRSDPVEFAHKAFNRLVAATLVPRAYRPEVEGTHPWLAALLQPLPLLGLAAALALRGLRRVPLLGYALCLYAGVIAPYALLAYYVRYLLPLTPLLALFVYWGADALAAARATPQTAANPASARCDR
jgi:hypothetical protein